MVLLLMSVGCGGADGRTGPAFTPSGESGDGGSTGPVSASAGEGSVGTTGGGSGEGADTDGASTTGDAPVGEAGSTGEESTCPRLEILLPPGEVLNVRGDPSTSNAPIGTLFQGAIVDVLGEVSGESIDGNDVWFHVATASLDGYVFSAFAACTLEEPPDLDANGYYLPLQCGSTVTVTQGNNGTKSHNGTSAHSFDFGLPLNTPIVAMADGVVVFIYDQTVPGDPCYNGGGSSCTDYANQVALRHADGTATAYKHLNAVSVTLGEVVPLGAQVGLSGSTGWSTGRHLHAVRTEDCGLAYCTSLPMSFQDVPGDGVPVTGQVVTSGNCP